MDMNQIETLAKEHAAARNELASRAEALEQEQSSALKRRLKGLRTAADRYKQTREQLKQAIANSPELFKKPKTRTMHGLRLGFMKRKGKLSWKSPGAVIERLRKLFPDKADAMINVSESPSKSALANLPAKDLKRLGCTVTDDMDKPFVKAVDGDIDKLIEVFLVEPPAKKAKSK